MGNRFRRRSIFSRIDLPPGFADIGPEAATTTLGTVTVESPATVEVGDLLIIDARVNYTSSSPLTVNIASGGWTEIGSVSDSSTGAGGSSTIVLTMWAKVATGSDFPVTVQRTATPTGSGYGLAASARVYRGVGSLVGVTSQRQGNLGVRYNPALNLSVPGTGILVSSAARRASTATIAVTTSNSSTTRAQFTSQSSATLTDTTTAPASVDVPIFDFGSAAADWCCLYARYNNA